MHPFNADFYDTAATVIPVLYLALTLQGTTYRDVMARFRKANKEAASKPVNRRSLAWYRGRLYPTMTALIALLAGALIVNGISGEYAALQALATEKTGVDTRMYVFNACVTLLAAVAAGPIVLLVSTLFGVAADADPKSIAAKIRVRFAAKPDAEAEPAVPDTGEA